MAEGERITKFTFTSNPIPMEIELNMNALTWGDNLHFVAIQGKVDKGELGQSEALEALTEMLSKIAGRDIRELPMKVVTEILEEFKNMVRVREETEKN